MTGLFSLLFLAAFIAIPVSLVKPEWFAWTGLYSRLQLVGAVSGAAVVSAFGIGLTAPPVEPVPAQDPAPLELVEEVEEAEEEPKVTPEGVLEVLQELQAEQAADEAPVETRSETPPPAPAPAPVVEPQPEPEPEPEPAPAPAPSVYCGHNLYNCPDFSTHAQAQAVHDACMAQVGYDVHGLDGNDNDGLACENLP